MANPELARKILDILRREHAEPGFHIREQWLADALGVSRSPVRTALKQLAALRVVRSEQHQGYFLEAAPGAPEFDNVDLPVDETQRLYRLIASERFANLLGAQVSVGDLVRRYEVGRSAIVKVLARMQEDGLVEKSSGHNWIFGPALNDEESYRESYRYRLLLEPGALLEPEFDMDPATRAQLRDTHEAVLRNGVENETLAGLIKIDGEFHDAIGQASGNRFLAQAIAQQTRLRRLSDYESYTTRENHERSIREHLGILDAIDDGDLPAAADRLREHITRADRTRPDFRKVRVLAHRRLTRR